jgi:hypothetical protein
VDWMHVAQDRDHGNEPWSCIKGGRYHALRLCMAQITHPVSLCAADIGLVSQLNILGAANHMLPTR